MSSLLITNIGLLAGTHPAEVAVLRGKQMAFLPIVKDAWLLCENGQIADFGSMQDLPKELPPFCETFSADGGHVLPAWCDSHTHLVFAASREEEFVMKIDGKSYAEIAAAGGGILNSARKVQQCTEEELFDSAWQRLQQVILLGTGAIEIKSGYGLTTDAELKMLRVIKRLKAVSPIPVKATFLAAHAYPEAYQEDHQGYIRLIIEEMLPQIAAEGLADYVDVFCEKGFFSVEEMSQILTAAASYGLPPKIHANQLSVSGAMEAAIQHGAVSVDHLEETNAASLKYLENSQTIATLLPGCSFYLNIPFANARAIIGAGAAVAIATDYNPGSSPSGNMNLVVSLACIKLKLSPEEAINAATLNGAAAMGLAAQLGSISIGKRANLIVTRPEVPSLAFLPYSFGQHHIQQMIINGKLYGQTRILQPISD